MLTTLGKKIKRLILIKQGDMKVAMTRPETVNGLVFRV